MKDFLFSVPDSTASFSTHNWGSLPATAVLSSVLNNAWQWFGSDFKALIAFPRILGRKVAISGGSLTPANLWNPEAHLVS